MADLSREGSKRLRAELAEGLGFYPASVAAEDVARYPGADRGAQNPRGSRRARWVGSGRLQVAPLGSPQGRTGPRRRRSPWPSRCGRPVRVSCDVNERWPSASVGVFPILRFPTHAIVVPCVTTFVLSD